MTGMLALSGGALPALTQCALAQAAVELADPSTPLGKAQAAAMKASTEGPADGSAYPRRRRPPSNIPASRST